MTGIAFVGPPRSGKTLFMTFHAYNDYINGHEIFSNYKLMFPHTLMSPYDMLKIPFDDVDRHPKTLCIQEASKWFDTRRSLRNENVLLSSLTGQAGKRNLSLYFDDQYFERIDRELRRSAEFIFHSRAIEVYTDNKTKAPIAFEYSRENMYSGEYIRLPLIPATLLAPYFAMYDSYESTIPMTIGKSMKELNKLYVKHPRETTEQETD